MSKFVRLTDDESELIVMQVDHNEYEEDRDMELAEHVATLLRNAPTMLPLIGRDASIIALVARDLRTKANLSHSVSPLINSTYESHFGITVYGDDDKPTGHVARITVTLERINQT